MLGDSRPEPKHIYEFEPNFESDGYFPVPIALITLSGGHTLRMFFTKEGVKLMIPKGAIDCGSVHIWDNGPDLLSGLGPLTKPEKEENAPNK
jgi:hypothetical protein